mgnify:CR=1 FL=1
MTAKARKATDEAAVPNPKSSDKVSAPDKEARRKELNRLRRASEAAITRSRTFRKTDLPDG